MSANVESMFYVRVASWHGLGVCVEEALNSSEALEKLGLNMDGGAAPYHHRWQANLWLQSKYMLDRWKDSWSSNRPLQGGTES